MLSTIIEIVSYLSFPSVLLTIALFGWMVVDASLFRQAVILGCLSVIINVALKGTFRVPLSPDLHPGFAFPSGHMQFAAVFYGWLLCHINHRLFQITVVALLAAFSLNMLQHHYHTVIEMLAGGLVGGLILFLYMHARQHHGQLPLLRRIWGMASLLMMYVIGIYAHVPKHTWHAYVLLTASMLLCEVSHRFLGTGFFLTKSGKRKVCG